MSLYRLWAILRKEFQHIARDVRLLFLVTVSPAFLLFTFSYVFATDLGQVALGVMDQDRSRLSRDLLAALTADGDVIIAATVWNYEDVELLFRHGRVEAVLVIPPRFEQDALSLKGAQLQLIVDGAESSIARQVIAEMGARTRAFAANHLSGLTISLMPVDLRTRVLYNPGQKSLISMVPGLLAVVLIMPGLALTLALTREREVGTFEMVISTPVRGIEYLIGKMLAYMVAGIGSAILAQLVAILWFRVPFRGTELAFLGLTLVYYSASMGLGLVLANFVRNQQTAMFIILLVSFVPSFFVSGLVIPIDRSSLASLAVSYSLPATHFITITRGLFLKGVDVRALWESVAYLAAMGGVAILTSLVLFKKRLD